MKYAIQTLLITILMLFVRPTFAQTRDHTSRLICKEWRLVSFEEEDGKFDPSPDQIGDRMKLELDHKIEYVEISEYKTGIWRYDARTKILTITNRRTQEKKAMKVVKITNTEFVLELKDSDGGPLKMYMVAVTRR